ncbi:M14 family metallopeptidase [Flavisolibacter ginsengisoli]|jgi:hypothetical protein|uniref:Zinc carboxypeptidase n=1 Tax=Flavisolibacter ginsengisoli DSM 18119 TaxID=1121884 RepID=A0A1M4U892_9BACT|nr:M14 family metallopeptidase [Flavisolibacter ginsengisoli]SHE52989.1 Zinc carboxypeptidase [Flavisolibacter ginsengisoli DSM 18119]
MKKLCALLTGIFLCVLSFAQLQSPEEFLGYKIGTRFTPHWRIVEYYKYVASKVPSLVKLQSYGRTYEGRELLVAYVSNASTITNLESVRHNNQALAQMAPGGEVSNAPAVVWLSYNVHGNETSSSEASLLTLFALVDSSNNKTKQWLQNTLVILDPCLNPDGRDRYVNWFNSVVGAQPNASLDAREHREPWPGGRSNHYYFDLNRDWVWQTQLETQERLHLYNEWLPQVHVDFHEQGIDDPYYFAPAAEPFHEVITPWQRDFQKTIGLNHARYFDEKGWLYFTKERFDLLYPSYGDTYPLYNGAIGMTYEQGGGNAGGLMVINSSSDTLTLLDRVTHHYTTGLSTVEVASQNASRLVAQFQEYYKNSMKGIGEYKSYVIKNDPRDAGRIKALLELLDKNKIEYNTGKAATYKGYNYDTGKEGTFNLESSDIIVQSAQPKGTLVKVLFEPSTRLSDSVTYDITAWALPYVYGVKAFATKQFISPGAKFDTSIINNAGQSYGYAIPWNGVQSVKLVTDLLQRGVKLRFSEHPFSIGSQQFQRGTVLILKTSNQFYPKLWDSIQHIATQFKIQLTPVSSGFVDKGNDLGSPYIRPLAKRRIAMLTGDGVSTLSTGEVWHFFDQQLHYPITLINANDVNRINWSNYDVLILPNGNYRFLSDKPQTDLLKTWIQGGGHVIALESAVAQLAHLDWTIKQKKEEEPETKDIYASLKKYEDRERDYIPNTTPGSIYKVDLDNTHPLAFGFPDYYYTLKQDDAIYEFIKEGGWNVGVIKKEKQVAGFVGAKLQSHLQDGLLFGVQDIGQGTITYLADDVLFRSFWENGKLLFSNAVFLVGQ